MKEDKLYLDCECGAEVLRLEKEKDDCNEGEVYTGNIYVSVFSKMRTTSVFWLIKHRIEQIWHIIKHGEPYGDNVIISLEDREKMIKFLK